MPRPVHPRSDPPARRATTGRRVRHVAELRAGDVVEIRTWDTVHCRGEVDAVCPRLDVLWVLDEPQRERMMVQASEHTVWRMPR
jgi:hypothetical protein